MPLYGLACPNGHTKDEYCHTAAHKGTRVHPCPQCGERMDYTLSLGRGLCYFGEGESRVLENLGHEPVTVTSYKGHEDAMKRHGVRLLPPKYGEKGCWT
jgi:hypothetical protein